MYVLIVKRGALGDVVRTSYFAKALKIRWGRALRLSWITAPASVELLRLNPSIDDLWTDFEAARLRRFDRIYSLDDEIEALEGVATLGAGAITGAFLRDGQPCYSEDAAEWFDMGLRSRFGKQRADELKKLNKRSHAQIFASIFGVDSVSPEFHVDPRSLEWAGANLPAGEKKIGINPCSGGRWPSKELPAAELQRLIRRILDDRRQFAGDVTLALFGAGDDYKRNSDLVASIGDPRVIVVCTDESVQHLAAALGKMAYLVSSDSLALHLGIAQNVPFTAFFSPTSAAEIDDWGIGTKVSSTSADYCSYRKDADNSTITAERIIAAIRRNPWARSLMCAHAA